MEKPECRYCGATKEENGVELGLVNGEWICSVCLEDDDDEDIFDDDDLPF